MKKQASNCSVSRWDFVELETTANPALHHLIQIFIQINRWPCLSLNFDRIKKYIYYTYSICHSLLVHLRLLPEKR